MFTTVDYLFVSEILYTSHPSFFSCHDQESDFVFLRSLLLGKLEHELIHNVWEDIATFHFSTCLWSIKHSLI